MRGNAVESIGTGAERAQPMLRPAASPLCAVSLATWNRLGDRAAEPNGFFTAGYSIPAFELTGKLSNPRLLLATPDAGEKTVIGLLPVVSAWSALRLPVPALVAQQPYSPLTVPLLHADRAEEAAGLLIDAARTSGARVLSLPAMTLDGPAFAALTAAMDRRGLRPAVHNRHQRAVLDATAEAETYLRETLGGKKLKELRRQRSRLADKGAVAFTIANTPDRVMPALERFLVLEASGWKGAGGTGLAQAERDAAFVRTAAATLSTRGRIEIAELTLNDEVVASGILIRQCDRVLFFKIAYDESRARYSPGVQLTLELTRHYAADPQVALVDSTADAGHPMIDHVWRERLTIADLLIPTRPNDPIAAAIIGLMAARRSAREGAKRLLRATSNSRRNARDCSADRRRLCV